MGDDHQALGNGTPGEFAVSAPTSDLAFRFMLHRPGEKPRPEARPTASVTEGPPPLEVRFGSSANSKTRWNFGDGAVSDESKPVHVFEKPGIYSVTLTVTDAEGGSARSFVQIAVDRRSDDPIVRAGFAEGEKPSLTPHGTARRTDGGSLYLPDGSPWGWVQAGDAVRDDLRGLARSRSSAGSAPRVSRSATAGTGSSSASTTTTPASTWSATPTADCASP